MENNNQQIAELSKMVAVLTEYIEKLQDRIIGIEAQLDIKLPEGEDYIKPEVVYTEKQLDEIEDTKLSKYLIKHYLADCDLDEVLSAEEFRNFGFEFTDEQIKEARAKYNEVQNDD